MFCTKTIHSLVKATSKMKTIITFIGSLKLVLGINEGRLGGTLRSFRGLTRIKRLADKV